MPSDPIPPCPVCNHGLYCFEGIVHHKPANDACWYRNTVEAHIALCAFVEKGRAVEDATRHLDLARRSIEEAQEQRDQAIWERDAAIARAVAQELEKWAPLVHAVWRDSDSCSVLVQERLDELDHEALSQMINIRERQYRELREPEPEPAQEPMAVATQEEPTAAPTTEGYLDLFGALVGKPEPAQPIAEARLEMERAALAAVEDM